ncbi:MAG TPA: GNAT family N-acetyltransferase [Steroidobacteraceae bacterium]|nr:GNAT family N-acetyltransferase [Steroidobacteraceae bacterium]HEU5468778.1 GNAT family N-acetyltransferase [Steroidobacteraceae bacterium]
MELRRAVPADAPSLAVLAERTFRDAFGPRNSPENMDQHCAKVFGAEIQLREIGDRGLVTTIAEDGGRMIGFSQVRLMHAHPSVAAARAAELNRIYVIAGWHGRGIGRLLLQDAKESAAAAGCDCLWLGVWEHNPKALAFYRQQGFEIVGTHAFMLGQDRQRDLVMSMKLG